MMSSQHVRVRFAPSPTGHLHIGGLRTALFNYLFARHNKGEFLLRIEDTDLERSTDEYHKSILDSFAWVNIHADEPIVIQSQRLEEHLAVANSLVNAGKAYRCYCSGQDLVARYDSSPDAELYISYDGFCADRTPQPGDDQKSYVIRFRLPKNQQEVVFNDLIRGPISIGMDQLDDFIIVRSGGYPMYNFVVVVDDAFMKITHIIRGEEHIVNTPKQILLHQACGYEPPLFAHLPLILGASGEKLSKRDAAVSVIEYAREGYLPQALLNYLARLGWSHGDQEIFSMDELINYFVLDAVGKKSSIFDLEKLAWVNSVYIQQLPAKDLLTHIVKDVDSTFRQRITWDEDRLLKAIELYKERAKTLRVMVDEIVIMHDGPRHRDALDVQKWITAESKHHLEALIDVLEKTDQFTSEVLAESIKHVAKRYDVKLVAIAQPIRIALQGKASGPGVFEVLALIGKKESIARLKALLNDL